jgi:hypothetical protein
MRSSIGASFIISSSENLRGLAQSPSTETVHGEVRNCWEFFDGWFLLVPNS